MNQDRFANKILIWALNRVGSLNEELKQLRIANDSLQQEILQRHQLEQKLRHDALHDSLTKLPNRNLFIECVEEYLAGTKDNSNRQFALLFIDLDRFKVINDSLGHLMGDRLLVACAEKLSLCISKPTILARLGGDEFTILLDITSVNDAVVVAEKILQEFATPFNIDNRYIAIAVSIGIVIGDSEYTQEQLLHDADTALHHAKESGKDRYEIFDPQMHLKARERLKWENELRQAISQSKLVLYYQPIFCLDSQQLAGFEAIVRWQHPQKGLVSPGEFIPLAEETGLIVPLGKWVMKQACHQLKVWQDNLPMAKSLTMSINVAGEQLQDPNFIDLVDRIIAETRVNCQCLKFEIVESMLIADVQQAIAVMNKIKQRHIQISIDDFGTGYSSLSYLPQFPADILKIDRSFVEKMNIETQNLEVVRAIVTLARVLKMQVIAEGIQDREQLNILKSLKVDFGQGFLLSKPLTAELAEKTIGLQQK